LSGNPALLLVDPEFEAALQEALQASHDPLPCSSALHQDDDIVGIAGKTVRAFLKLFVQIIQDNVGK
jgi:hypothetical protein